MLRLRRSKADLLRSSKQAQCWSEAERRSDFGRRSTAQRGKASCCGRQPAWRIRSEPLRSASLQRSRWHPLHRAECPR